MNSSSEKKIMNEVVWHKNDFGIIMICKELVHHIRDFD